MCIFIPFYFRVSHFVCNIAPCYKCEYRPKGMKRRSEKRIKDDKLKKYEKILV